MAAHALSTFLATAEEDAAAIACQVLGMELSDDQRGLRPYRDALRAHALGHDGGLHACAVALAFGIAEAGIRRRFPRGADRHHVEEHVTFLAGHRYELTPAECAQLRVHGVDALATSPPTSEA